MFLQATRADAEPVTLQKYHCQENERGKMHRLVLLPGDLAGSPTLGVRGVPFEIRDKLLETPQEGMSCVGPRD